jgi:hypothetical protein
MTLATLVDTDALWHVALYSLLAALGLTAAYGTAVLALDRLDRAGGSARAGWTALIGAMGAVCVGLLAVGFWAMTQK